MAEISGIGSICSRRFPTVRQRCRVEEASNRASWGCDQGRPEFVPMANAIKPAGVIMCVCDSVRFARAARDRQTGSAQLISVVQAQCVQQCISESDRPSDVRRAWFQHDCQYPYAAGGSPGRSLQRLQVRLCCFPRNMIPRSGIGTPNRRGLCERGLRPNGGH